MLKTRQILASRSDLGKTARKREFSRSFRPTCPIFNPARTSWTYSNPGNNLTDESILSPCGMLVWPSISAWRNFWFVIILLLPIWIFNITFASIWVFLEIIASCSLFNHLFPPDIRALSAPNTGTKRATRSKFVYGITGRSTIYCLVVR